MRKLNDVYPIHNTQEKRLFLFTDLRQIQLLSSFEPGAIFDVYLNTVKDYFCIITSF